MQLPGKKGRCPPSPRRRLEECDLPKAVQSQNSAAERRLARIPQLFGPLTHQNVSPVTIMSHCVQEGVVHQEAVPFSPALGLTTNNQLTTRRDLQACEERMGIHYSCLCSGGLPTQWASQARFCGLLKGGRSTFTTQYGLKDVKTLGSMRQKGD